MRLLKRAEYEAVYGAGQRRSSSQFSVFFRAQSSLPIEVSKRVQGVKSVSAGMHSERMQTGELDGTSRFGISVKKALGGAVVRNRIRRRIREILRRNRTYIPMGWDIVIHPRASVAKAPFALLEAELVRLLRGLPRGQAGIESAVKKP
jgi:ribonuclease P protein component